MAEEQDKAFDNIILIDKEPSVPDNTLADAQRPLTPEAEIPAPTQPTKRKLPDSFGQRTALNHGKKKKGGKVGSRGAIGGRTRSQPTLVPTELGWIKDEPVPSTIHPPSREAMNYTISGVPIKFPFKAYESQIVMMSHTIKSLQKAQHAILESPTGTGKTLALLVSVVAWREQEAARLREEHGKLAQQHAEDYARLVEEMAMHSAVAAPPDRVDAENITPKNKAPRPITYDDGPVPQQLPSTTYPTITPEMGIAAQYARYMSPKLPTIYFTSRTQKQLQQVVKELRNNTVYRPRISVLASRAHYCVNPDLRHSHDRNEECDNLVRHNNCTYSNGVQNLKTRKEMNGIWDIEDIVKLGKKAARQLTDSADIIFLPYNYVIDPLIREASGVELAGNILIIDEAHNIEDTSSDAGSILDLGFGKLTDAAHELDKLRTIDQHAPQQGYAGLFDLAKGLTQLQMDFAGGKIEYDGTKVSKIWAGQRMLDVLSSIGVSVSPENFQVLRLGIQTANAKLEELRNPQIENREKLPDEQRPLGSIWFMQVFEAIVMVFGLLSEGFADDYRLVLIKDKVKMTSSSAARYQGLDELSSSEYSIEFWCMNPAVIFKKIADTARSIILTSGTLSPLSSFETELGVTFHQKFEAKHVVGDDQVWAGVVTTSSPPFGIALRGTFVNQEDKLYLDGLAESVRRIVKSVAGGGGILVFVPSYRWISSLLQRLPDVGVKEFKEEEEEGANQENAYLKCESRQLYVEPRSNTQGEFDGVMVDYSKAVKCGEGAVMICVQRGKMSEGIDFPNDLVRAVVLIGVPFPHLKDLRVKEKKQWNDSRRQSSKGPTTGLSGSEWYEVQAYRAVNQSLGRCIRHKDDWGAIILLDDRFAETRSQNMISKWARSRMRTFNEFTTAEQSLVTFFEERANAEKVEKQQARKVENNVDNVFVPTPLPMTPNKERGAATSKDVFPTPVSLRKRKVDERGNVKIENDEDNFNDDDAMGNLIEVDDPIPGEATEAAREMNGDEMDAKQKRRGRGTVDLSKFRYRQKVPSAFDADEPSSNQEPRSTTHTLRCPRCKDAYLELPSEKALVTRLVKCPELLRMRDPDATITTKEMTIVPAGFSEMELARMPPGSGRKGKRGWAKKNAWWSEEEGRCYVWFGCVECGSKMDILG